MNRFDKLSVWYGAFLIGFFWSGSDLITAEDIHSFTFVVDLVFTAVCAVMAVWTVMQVNRRISSTGAAHIDTEGVFAALRCTGCNGHLMYLEHGHDLTRLTSARDSHECASKVEQDGAR